MKAERKCRKVVFSNQPLVLVLAQLRFSPLPNMGDYIPAIQDSLRKEGFPHYSIKQGFGIEISQEGVKQNNLSQWFFEATDRLTSFLVDTEQVVFQTTSYHSFEVFMGTFSKLVDVVLNLTEQSRHGLVQRMGLRFVNVIRGGDWRVYLKPSFHGTDLPLLNPIGQLHAHMSMGKVKLDESSDSTFVLRMNQSSDGAALPPDLMAFAPAVATRDSQPALSTIIDLDHFWQGTIGPGVTFESLERTFFALHDSIIEVFHEAVISEEATKRWS